MVHVTTDKEANVAADNVDNVYYAYYVYLFLYVYMMLMTVVR